MLAVTRFQSPGHDFEQRAMRVVEFWRSCAGNRRVDLVRNLDDPGLWAIIGEWDNVGAYRRSFQGYEAKMVLTEVLLLAVDEPSAYHAMEEFGQAPW